MSTFIATYPILWSLILVVIGIAFTLLCIWGIPKLKQKLGEKDFNMDANMLESVLIGLESVLKVMDKDPSKDNFWEMLVKMATQLVQTAEKIPNWDEKSKSMSKDELNKYKFDWVKGQMKTILKEEKIDLTKDREQLLDSAIKVAVNLYTSHTK